MLSENLKIVAVTRMWAIHKEDWWINHQFKAELESKTNM